MQGRQRACIQKLIRQGDLPEWWVNTGTHAGPGDSLAQPANQGVVFGHHQYLGLRRCRQYRVFIQRLDRWRMQHGNLDPF